MKKQLFLALMGLAALVLSACGAIGPPSGGVASAPSPAGGDQAAVDLSSVSEGLAGLNSYRASFTMTFEGKDAEGQDQSGSFTSIEEFSKNPPAKRTVISGFGAGDVTGGEIQSIEVGGKSYSILGDICASSDAAGAPAANATFTPSSVIGSIQGSQFVGVENVNGVPARHFVVDTGGAFKTGAYSEAKADAWIADPGNFVVRYILEATGKDAFFGSGGELEGRVRIEYNVTGVNQPVNIAAPENCGGAPQDIPLMPDAVDVGALGGTTTYNSPTAFADVVAFYKGQMPANGWTELEGGLSAEDFAQLKFAKGGRQASVSISADPANNRTTVVIAVSGE